MFQRQIIILPKKIVLGDAAASPASPASTALPNGESGISYDMNKIFKNNSKHFGQAVH